MVALPPSFCPQCGTELTDRHVEGRDRPYCPTCETVVWQNPVPTAAVAVVDGERVLLVERRHEPDAGLWGIPAGYLEAEETAAQAAARELAEEAGIDVDVDALTLLTVGQFDHPSGRNLVTVSYAVPRERTRGEPVAGSDAAAVGFFDAAAFTGDAAPLRPSDAERVRLALERFGES